MSLYAITFRRRTFTAYDAARTASDIARIYRRLVRDYGKPCAVEVMRWKSDADFVSQPGAILIKRGLIGEVA
jgi:hypothetical protein